MPCQANVASWYPWASTWQVFLMERLYMRRELYFSIVLDRAYGGPVIVASTCGGTSIEDVAARSPELILKVCGHPAVTAVFA